MLRQGTDAWDCHEGLELLEELLTMRVCVRDSTHRLTPAQGFDSEGGEPPPEAVLEIWGGSSQD